MNKYLVSGLLSAATLAGAVAPVAAKVRYGRPVSVSAPGPAATPAAQPIKIVPVDGDKKVMPEIREKKKLEKIERKIERRAERKAVREMRKKLR